MTEESNTPLPYDELTPEELADTSRICPLDEVPSFSNEAGRGPVQEFDRVTTELDEIARYDVGRAADGKPISLPVLSAEPAPVSKPINHSTEPSVWCREFGLGK